MKVTYQNWGHLSLASWLMNFIVLYSLTKMRQFHIFSIKPKLDMGLFVDFCVQGCIKFLKSDFIPEPDFKNLHFFQSSKLLFIFHFQLLLLDNVTFIITYSFIPIWCWKSKKRLRNAISVHFFSEMCQELHSCLYHL